MTTAAGATCSWCGRQVDEPPLGWTMTTTERGIEWMCEACTRSNLRGVEGRLATDWW